MPAIFEVRADKLIEKAAEELKKIEVMQPPEWVNFVKTGVHKERLPVDPDWWYFRAAAILRNVFILGPIGVSKLRTRFGEGKRRGHKPKHFYKAGGNIIRKILQRLERAGLIHKVEKGVHKGKVLTSQGAAFLNSIVVNITGKPLVKKEKVKAEKPKADAREKPKKKRGRPKKKKAEEKSKEEVKEETLKEPKKEETKEEVKAE